MDRKVLSSQSYNFNARSKTVSFLLPLVLKKENILMVLNLKENTVIYNFADNTEGGTYSNGILTLDHDTTLMSNSDDLMVIISEEKDDILDKILSEIKQSNEFLCLINTNIYESSN